MSLRSEKIIHMADELSNVNGGSSTNDSILVIMQSADITSCSEGVIGSESIAVTTVQIGSVGRNIRLRGSSPPIQPPLTIGWPPYGLSPGYTPPVSGFAPPVRFGSTSGINNHKNPQQHFEYSRDYNVGSTSNAANSMAVYQQHVEKSRHDLVNLLTQQMITILNPMMADHEVKFESLAIQVERIAQIVDYEEDERHDDARENNEGFKNVFQNENNILNRKNPHIVLRGQDADEVLARLRANHGGERYQVTRIMEEVLNQTKFDNDMESVSTTFHAQFYRGELNVAVIDLVALKREDGETIDDYMIRFKNARSRCYVSLPESEVVKIAVMGLGFYMCQKLLNVHIPDLAHLAERVHQIKRMKKEKEKHRNEKKLKSNPFTRKEKVTYVTMESSEEKLDFETEIDLAELKKGPPYVCSLLKKLPSNEKDLIQEAITEVRLKFDDGKKEMKVDVDPFNADASQRKK
ncbi:hypothetical protein Ahy_A05g025201 [Arachis hypogaea]|uniref:Retrotransposon gag domain-containing protein n=1 Tax=Arachis hypogaea TaxID=3818 RepID=A0A445D8E4_ARAHY|nr:hypothetical protein Ahy_A05g025201 [Arachis hypogaea]